MKRFRVTGKNGVVLGVHKATNMLEAWRICCREHGIDEGARASSIEPGVTIAEVKPEDFKPTHVIEANGRSIEVAREIAAGYPNLELFYTKEEWLDHIVNQWDRVGTKIRFKGKEKSYVTIKEIGK